MILKVLLPILVVTLLFVIWFGGGAKIVQNMVSSTTVPTVTQTAVPSTPINTPTAIPTNQALSIPNGWQTYTNSQYGFSISYPTNFKALSDKENLYGWPNGVVLIYGGGQAYDIAIEIWNTEAEYKAKYPGETLAVYTLNGKFLTIADQTKSAENSAIISTFELTK